MKIIINFLKPIYKESLFNMIHVTNCYLLIEIGTLLELLSCQNVCSASPLIPCYAATSWGETILEDILQLISTNSYRTLRQL